jgi:hypothetical protein
MLNNLQIVSNAVTMDALKRLQAETAEGQKLKLRKLKR